MMIGILQVPQVFLDGNFVGDCSKVKADISKGTLTKKLKDEGIIA